MGEGGVYREFDAQGRVDGEEGGVEEGRRAEGRAVSGAEGEFGVWGVEGVEGVG